MASPGALLPESRQGWLYKLGRHSWSFQWHKRYFMLNGHQLCYFKGLPQPHQVGKHSLPGRLSDAFSCACFVSCPSQSARRTFVCASASQRAYPIAIVPFVKVHTTSTGLRKRKVDHSHEVEGIGEASPRQHDCRQLEQGGVLKQKAACDEKKSTDFVPSVHCRFPGRSGTWATIAEWTIWGSTRLVERSVCQSIHAAHDYLLELVDFYGGTHVLNACELCRWYTCFSSTFNGSACGYWM